MAGGCRSVRGGGCCPCPPASGKPGPRPAPPPPTRPRPPRRPAARRRRAARGPRRGVGGARGGGARRGCAAVDPDHRPHLVAALNWLAGAQDASGEGGVARGYSLGWNPSFGSRAWQPADPGATGYIIPILYGAARHLHRPGLAERAERAARWELELQLPSGAVRQGVISERTAPGAFNTGRGLLAWLRAFAETGAGVFAGAARRAAWVLLAPPSEGGGW